LKTDLIVIPSFLANSFILHGLIEYLEEYFSLHFIELPGFNDNHERSTKIDINFYSKYVDSEIIKLNLDSYWIAGISFGFIIANICSHAKGCKGVLAVEPYINKSSLNRGSLKLYIVGLSLKLICSLNLHHWLWKNRLFVLFLQHYIFPSRELFDITHKAFDPFVFFETAKLIFSYTEPLVLKHGRNILVINKMDDMVSAPEIIKMFLHEAPSSLVIQTTSSHYPVEITKEYFEENISNEDIGRLLGFIQCHHEKEKV
jgi:hypothetical protein